MSEVSEEQFGAQDESRSEGRSEGRVGQEDDTGPARRPAGTGARWVAMSALVSGYLLTFVVRYGTAVVLPELRVDLGAGEAALGALAAAYFWPYALMQPAAGVLADWWGARRAVAVFLTVAAAGTALFAAAPGFPVALVGRALGGAGVGIVFICGISVIGQWVSPARFGTATGLYSATGIVGGLVAARPLDAVVGVVGWRAAFAIVAALLLATAALAAAPVPGAQRAPGAPRPRPLAGFRTALGLPNVWLAGAYAFVVLGILSSMQGLWTIPFLTDVYDLDEGRSAAVLEALSIGLLVAMPFWGYLADRVLRSRRRAILISLVVQIATWGLLAGWPTACPPELLYPLFLVAGFSNGCWMPAYALVRSSSPTAVVSTALGLLNFAFFFGAALFQQGTGVLLEWFDDGGDVLPTAAYQALFASFCAALVVAAACVAASREGPVEEGR